MIYTKLYVFSLALPAAPPDCPLVPEPPVCLPPSEDCTRRFKEDALVRTDPPYVKTYISVKIERYVCKYEGISTATNINITCIRTFLDFIHN